jgi:hypothetical protein
MTGCRGINMRQRASALVVLIVLFMSAGSAWASSGWSDYGLIGEFNQQGGVTPGNEMLFFQVAPTSNPSGCATPNSYYLPVVTDLQKRLFVMLLTAKTSGKRVRLYVTGTCHVWGYSEIQGAIIE